MEAPTTKPSAPPPGTAARGPLAGLPALLAVVGVILLFALAGAIFRHRRGEVTPEEFVRVQIEGLKDPDVRIRRGSALRLRPLGDPRLAEAAVPALLDALGDEDEMTRRYAIETLSSLGAEFFGLKPGEAFGFAPEGPPEARAKAAAAWRAWWAERPRRPTGRPARTANP